MREAQLAQYNYILVVGEEEAKNERVSYFFCCKFLVLFFFYLKDGQISLQLSESKWIPILFEYCLGLNNISFFFYILFSE